MSHDNLYSQNCRNSVYEWTLETVVWLVSDQARILLYFTADGNTIYAESFLIGKVRKNWEKLH